MGVGHDVFLLAATVSACATGQSVQGETAAAYPTRQIEYIVPYSAGGGVDLVARATADYLSKEWGQPIVVVNKAGGGGAVGAEFALKQAKTTATRHWRSTCRIRRCWPLA